MKNIMKFKIISLALIYSIMFVSPCISDQVILKNGNTIDAISAWVDGNNVECAIKSGQVSIPMNDVKKIVRDSGGGKPRSGAISPDGSKQNSSLQSTPTIKCIADAGQCIDGCRPLFNESAMRGSGCLQRCHDEFDACMQIAKYQMYPNLYKMRNKMIRNYQRGYWGK